MIKLQYPYKPVSDNFYKMDLFQAFDPLEAKQTTVSAAALSALKREIDNILSSYVGWYDPFCELIQNSLDSLEARQLYENSSSPNKTYTPKLSILINIDENSLTVSENGIGLDKDKFYQFLAPNFSFKLPENNTRGRKGVGATYVAYGFNYMRIETKSPGFHATGKLINARKWLNDSTSNTNPKVEPDNTSNPDNFFDDVDRGVSITVRFDNTTRPKLLSWPQIKTAEAWFKILSIKTGLGAIKANENIIVTIKLKENNKLDTYENKGIGYFWLHNENNKAIKSKRYSEIKSKFLKIQEKKGPHNIKLPNSYNNLDFIYDQWNAEELKKLLRNLDESEEEIINEYNPIVFVEFGYTATLWSKFNDTLNLRKNTKILSSGIQLAANNMPQGEIIQVPLNRNIGRQNQVHFLIHFENYTPDLGRKGFQQELVEFAKSISRQIVENHLLNYRFSLKQNTGAAPDLERKLKIDEWKQKFLEHESKKPLSLESKYFFHPTERISITSTPTREQDVIALFNQLIAGGVIRSINIMSTNEHFTYDGLFKISFDLDKDLYLYNKEKNPLGINEHTLNSLIGKISPPFILEYKYSLDGLIEDINNQDKNIKDIDLCVAWTIGKKYQDKYNITSLLIPENISQREYHGITHSLFDYESGNKLCDLIILSDLINFLNNQEKTIKEQQDTYEY